MGAEDVEGTFGEGAGDEEEDVVKVRPHPDGVRGLGDPSERRTAWVMSARAARRAGRSP